MLAELALLGVGPGKLFADFKEESDIDDWFEIESARGGVREVSLTCGLSPVVDDDGKITALYRSRKLFGGKSPAGATATQSLIACPVPKARLR